MYKNPNIPQRHETRRPSKKGAVALASLAALGMGWMAKDAIQSNSQEAPITAYMPSSKAAEQNPEAYEAQFSTYTVGMESKHDKGKMLNNIEDLAQEYALDHGMSDTYAVQDELTRQAVTFNKQQNHQDNNPNIYPGQPFELPNQPYAGEALQQP